MRRLVVSSLAVFVAVAGAGAAAARDASPGSAGVGDPYFPKDGNGGYDVAHYDLDITYDPETDRLTGVATVEAYATQNLSAFNLDLDGLRVRSVAVDGNAATWSRSRGELTVNPGSVLSTGSRFTVTVRYDGVPRPVVDEFGESGFLHTDDGAVVVGQPHVAATWYPVNDHPSDKASYSFDITVPQELVALANGELVGRSTSAGWTTWSWRAAEPMASYLTTATVGRFDLRTYQADGIDYWDAIDPALLTPLARPRTGAQYALTQKTAADVASYKRLSRRVAVPARGGSLAFSIARDTEPDWDFVFVEARTVGRNDWTTLRDSNGHTRRSTGASCPAWLELHPFLRHYQTAKDDGTCASRGTTGRWWAASGASDGWERWRVDLSRFAGRTAQVSITYASDDFSQLRGAVVDDIAVPGHNGSTSFEHDGNTRDGWRSLPAPRGSTPNPNSWSVGTEADLPPSLGETARDSLSRQPEIIRFLSQTFGDYPFKSAGGIVDDVEIFFALENQTRPIYSKYFFTSPAEGDGVVVHELAHQWYGDSLAVERWQDIWLNEGFATYAEWLWSEEDGRDSVQQLFNFSYREFPAKDPFWDLRIGDPGPGSMFDSAVYIRGAMTLHQVRLAVGDADFFTILRRWADEFAGGNVTTPQFVRLAEDVSGEDLSPLFRTWLFTPGKPAV